MNKQTLKDQTLQIIELYNTGMITAAQAKNRAKVLRYKFRQMKRFERLQKTNPELWMACTRLRGMK